jgi:hypothetical protein
MNRMYLHFSVLFLSVLFTACGPGDPGASDGSDRPAQEATPPAEPGILEGEDLNGIEQRSVTFTLHWVGGPVSRDPTPGAPAVALGDVTTRAAIGFDRMIFHFGEGAFPGYEVVWSEGAPSDCASGQAVAVAGQRGLQLRLRSVTAAPTVLRSIEPGYSNLKALAPTCARDGDVVWALGVQAAADIRVIEMRSPLRLVVDVRHP